MHVVGLDSQGGVAKASRAQPAAGVDDDRSAGEGVNRLDVPEADAIEIWAERSALLRGLIDLAKNLPPGRHDRDYPFVVEEEPMCGVLAWTPAR